MSTRISSCSTKGRIVDMSEDDIHSLSAIVREAQAKRNYHEQDTPKKVADFPSNGSCGRSTPNSACFFGFRIFCKCALPRSGQMFEELLTLRAPGKPQTRLQAEDAPDNR